MKRIGMLTSGGDCQSLNATMRGVVKGLNVLEGTVEIYGFIDGYKGLIYGNYKRLTSKDFSGILTTGGTILGTSRQPFKLMRTPDENGLDKVEAMKSTYRYLDLDCLVVLGGNGSQKTANLLREEGLNIVSLPKTIDNDLVGIDHSPGFGSAAKYIALAVKNVAYDTSIYSIKSVHIIEAMGRNAGWLTAASALARDGDSVAPHLIYLPEIPFSVDKFVDDVKGKLDEYNSVIVVVSEGIKDENGEYISARGDKVDKFGHVMLSGTGAYLKSVVEERIGCKVRALEPSVLQRSAGHTASMTDVTEAYNLGVVAVKAALDGKTGVFSTLRRISDLPYTVDYYTEQVSVVANNEKLVPRSWINEQGNDVTNKMIEYLSPLVKGVPQVPYRNGLPDYIGLSHLDVKKQKYSD